MSNANPTIEEIAKVIESINYRLDDVLFSAYPHLEPPTLFTMESNGYDTIINCLGAFVWSDENDSRNCLEDDEGEEIIINGEETKEGLEEYLIKEFKKIVEMVGFFKDSLDKESE